jgi:hypothetical protein
LETTAGEQVVVSDLEVAGVVDDSASGVMALFDLLSADWVSAFDDSFTLLGIRFVGTVASGLLMLLMEVEHVFSPGIADDSADTTAGLLLVVLVLFVFLLPA